MIMDFSVDVGGTVGYRTVPWLVTEGSCGGTHQGQVVWVGLLQLSREGSMMGWTGVWQTGKRIEDVYGDR